MIVFRSIGKLPRALPAARLARLGRELARVLRKKKAREVGLRFVGLKTMQTLNRVYRQLNRPTDVLSFEPSQQMPRTASDREAGDWLGDVVICPQYAAREARRRAISGEEELVRLIAHGVLHLVGYDHATEEEESKMFALQEKVVERCLTNKV